MRSRLRDLGKRLLRAVAPDWTDEWLAGRARAAAQDYLRSVGVESVNARLLAHVGDRVVSGPFAGTRLSTATHAEQIGPYLLGLYESELDSAWELILRGRYDRIVDVGAKFGYYAVGLARRYPEAEVVAYDTDRWAREAMVEMCTLNGVSNVRIERACRPDDLASLASARTLVVSDCEGWEASLFTRPVFAALDRAVLLIETHDFAVPEVTAWLTARMETTHVPVRLGATSRRPVQEDVLPHGLSDEERHLATHEIRGDATWLLGLPRRGPHAGMAHADDAAEGAA